MKNLLFNTPWWLPTLLAGAGIVLFWNGNRRQEARLRNIGLLLIALTVVVLSVSYLVDTDLEKCVKQSKRLVYDVEQQDWAGMKSILDPRVSVSVFNAGAIYSNRDETINAAQDGVNWWGVKNVRILRTDAEQTDSLITVHLAVLSDHDKAGIPTINTKWELEWQQTGDTWSLVRITCMQIGNLTGENAGRQFPRPR
jgi:hypothetical protein